MSTPTIADYLKFANLQMAAEALYTFNATPPGTNLTPGAKFNDPLTTAILTDGNLHASKFTATEAQKFVEQWAVVDHISNTTTGFSGTLFKATRDDLANGIKKDDLVLSFRSTEFIDDAARDNEATNNLEIRQKGFAFGQLSDMETWYQSLVRADKITGPLSVTGYSLGGHLATAFNLMHGEDPLSTGDKLIANVVTFNGAGIGRIDEANDLATMRSEMVKMVKKFNELRTQPTETGLSRELQTDYGRTVYQSLNSLWSPGMPRPSLTAVATLLALPNGGTAEVFSDLGLLRDAWNRADAVYREARRAPQLDSGSSEGINKPADIPDGSIAGELLDYQLAVLVTARKFKTSALSLSAGLDNALIAKTMGVGSPLTNQIDVVGTEMGTTVAAAMVANSQVHYGLDVPIFIEDQPGYRGMAPATAAYASFVNSGAKLLGEGYAKNDFGDTHSLVLIIDSLAVMDTLARIDPSLQGKPTEISLMLKGATATKVERNLLSQGKAEGDTLETVVDALFKLFRGTDPRMRELDGLNDGNTWWDIDRRQTFHQLLDGINIAIGNGPTRTIDLLTNKTASGLAGLAASDDIDGIAYRYALKELNPFAVLGDNSLYDRHNATGQLNLATSGSETGELTRQWIDDRATMLYWQIAANNANANFLRSDRISGAWDFTDRNSNRTIGVEQTGATWSASQRRLVTFGANAAETIAGGIQADHLYGGSGNDTLTGNAGADYLEGNADDDILDGGANNDTLVGGRGNDTLIGGAGEDTYVINAGDGADTIIDSGRNFIRYNGELFAGSFLKGTDGKYHFFTDNGKTFAFNSPGVLTLDAETRVTFQNQTSAAAFADGDFGFTLKDAPATVANPTTITGDLDVTDYTGVLAVGTPPDSAWRNLVLGAPNLDGDGRVVSWNIRYNLADTLGNLIGSGPGSARADQLHGSDSADKLLGKDGDDSIDAKDGNDLVEGGSGSDQIDGGAGDDRLYADTTVALPDLHAYGERSPVPDAAGGRIDGGAGDDLLVGGDGVDLLIGGDGADLLVGGAGNDLLRGYYGTGIFNTDIDSNTPTQRDVLYGGAGNDQLDGAAGNDLLDGGSGNGLRLHLESRRWRAGERTPIPSNHTFWRKAA